jgi:CheY-like chemotaxis protein
MHLPKVEGTAILKAMRENGLLPETPVFVLSSAISKQDSELMKDYDVARHLQKPADLDAFLQIGVTVRDLLSNNSC